MTVRHLANTWARRRGRRSGGQRRRARIQSSQETETSAEEKVTWPGHPFAQRPFAQRPPLHLPAVKKVGRCLGKGSGPVLTMGNKRGGDAGTRRYMADRPFFALADSIICVAFLYGQMLVCGLAPNMEQKPPISALYAQLKGLTRLCGAGICTVLASQNSQNHLRVECPLHSVVPFRGPPATARRHSPQAGKRPAREWFLPLRCPRRSLASQRLEWANKGL